jgi:hypothetical protein
MPIPEKIIIPASKDPGKGHFYVSLVKSVIRLAGASCFIALGYALEMPLMLAGGVLLFAAEVLGIAEEIV